MKSLPRIAVAALGAALVLAACGTTEEQAAGDSPGQRSPTSGESPTGHGSHQDGDAAEGRLITVSVRGGSVRGTDGSESVSVGDRVAIRVASDVADEVHLHGYDKKVAVTAGGTATLRFVADIPGVFEVELEDAGLLLFELEVR